MAAMMARLKEPSTYAGLGILLGVLGMDMASENLQSVVWFLAGGAGILAMFMPEKA